MELMRTGAVRIKHGFLGVQSAHGTITILVLNHVHSHQGIDSQRNGTLKQASPKLQGLK